MGAEAPLQQSLTLWPNDDLNFHDSGDIEVVFREQSQERVVMRSEHIRWYSLRERTVAVKKQEES